MTSRRPKGRPGPAAGADRQRAGARPREDRRLRVLVLEPFHGGSHRAVLEGLRRHSSHEIRARLLPAGRWKWRLRTAGLHFAQRVGGEVPRFDRVLASGLLDLAHFRALVPKGGPPCLLYLHENQISYPRPEGEPLDRGFAVAHLASILAADRVAVNSRFHRDELEGGLAAFLAEVPEGRPRGALGRVRRALVLPPGVETADLAGPHDRPPGDPPVILWNHRREFDKQPAVFFRVLRRLARGGLDFRLVLLGETTQALPRPFLAAREAFGSRILHDGWLPARRDYARWLRKADVVVSTATQENFGISVLEALAAGAYPLLPRRLSYLEILPSSLHERHLYRGERDLEGRLRGLLGRPESIPSGREARVRAAHRFSWERVAPRWDRALAATGGPSRGQPEGPPARCS